MNYLNRFLFHSELIPDGMGSASICAYRLWPADQGILEWIGLS